MLRWFPNLLKCPILPERNTTTLAHIGGLMATPGEVQKLTEVREELLPVTWFKLNAPLFPLAPRF